MAVLVRLSAGTTSSTHPSTETDLPGSRGWFVRVSVSLRVRVRVRVRARLSFSARVGARVRVRVRGDYVPTTVTRLVRCDNRV